MCRNVAVRIHAELPSPIDPYTRGHDLSPPYLMTPMSFVRPNPPRASSSYEREGGPGTETPRLRERTL